MNHMSSLIMKTYKMKAPIVKKMVGKVQPGKATPLKFPEKMQSFSHGDRNSHFNLLYVYFRFSFVFLCSPFRFQKRKDGSFEIYRWLPQQVLCGLANVLAVLKTVTALREALGNMKLGENSPLSYLQLFSRSGGVVYALALYMGFWFNSQSYLKLIQFLDDNPCLNHSRRHWVLSAAFAVLLCSTYSVFTLYYGTFSLLQSSNWSPLIWFQKLVLESRYTFYFDSKIYAQSSSQPFPMNVSNVIFAVAEVFGLQCRLFSSYFGDLCLLINVLSLYIPLSTFTSLIYSEMVVSIGENNCKKKENAAEFFMIQYDLKYYKIQDVEGKIKCFDALKTLSALIGNAVGNLILPFLLESLFYYSRSFHEILVTQDVGKRFRLLFYFTTTSIIILLSAEIIRQMRWFKHWLGEQVKLIDKNLFASILLDLKLNKVGISAAGMFPIDYSLVGAAATLSVTFFIVRLQSSDE